MSETHGSYEELQAELQALRSQVAALQADRDNLQQQYTHLEEQSRQHQALLGNSADFIGIANFAGEIYYLNQAGRNMVGFDEGEEPTNIINFFVEEDLPYVQNVILPTVQRDGMWQSEFRFRNFKTGGTVIVDYTLFVLKDRETGAPIALGTVTRDITERKAAEELQQKLVAVIENSSDFIGIADQTGKVMYLNEAGRKMIGFENDEEVYSSMIQSYFLPEDLQIVENTILPETMEKGRWEGEFRFRNIKTGAPIPVSYNLFAVRDKDTNELIALSTVSRDIAEQQQREQELRTFFALSENAPDGVIVATLNGVITYANAESLSLSGCEESMEGMQIAELFGGTDDEYAAVFDTTFEQGYWQGNWDYVRKDGNRIHALVSSFLIRDEDGDSFALGFIIRDISENIRAEEERAALQEQVIQAQRIAIRELGTPLIPLADGIVAMPLVGTIDTSRAQQIMETLLEGVASNQAEVVILDITGVRVIDTQVADALVRTARAASLLGSEVVITGIGPEVAQTLVQLGVDLGNIATRSTLQTGIIYAMETRQISWTKSN